jgi:hypothetical protein
MKTLEQLRADVVSYGFFLAGSRLVLPEIAEKHQADWDYIGVDTKESRDLLLESDGWIVSTVSNHYGDDSSAAVYVNTFNPNIQVVLKHPEYWARVNQFWKHMVKQPDYFRTQFWKSYKEDGILVNTREKIVKRMNAYWDSRRES